MTYDKAAVQTILDQALADGRTSVSAPEAKQVADAYGIPTPGEGLATTAEGAAGLAAGIGFPVVLKIVSPDILHKTDAGGVVVGVDSADAARTAYAKIVDNAKAYKADAEIVGIQVQKLLVTGGDVQEVIIGAVTDPTFGKVVAFGLGGVLVDAGLTLMDIPDDLDAAFRKFIPPFGAAGNPVDITGGEPPATYRNTIALGLSDERIHALILGYWHTIVTPPMVFAKLVAEVVEEFRAKGIDKPVVASLSGDVEVEEASQYLFDHSVVAYPYTTETPVEVLGAKYRWARNAGPLGS